MSFVFNALSPVILIILIGWSLRHWNVIEERDWTGLERIAYRIFFPAIIVITLTKADMGNVPVLAVSMALIVTVCLVAGSLVIARPIIQKTFSLDGAAFTSVFQSCTRWNSFIALALAQGFYGAHGVALIAVALAAMTPLLNIMAISVLLRHGTHKTKASPPEAYHALKTIALNPLIWSCLLGIILNPFQNLVPSFASATLDMLGRAAFAAGLLTVGAGLDMKAVTKIRSVHAMSIFIKLVIFPLSAVALARYLGVNGSDLGALIIASSVPTAGAGYILARQMGGDSQLMAELITLQSLVALITLPFILAALGA
jgi:malonate transporter and related proteins